MFALKGDLNGENRSGAFLLLLGICCLLLRLLEAILGKLCYNSMVAIMFNGSK